MDKSKLFLLVSGIGVFIFYMIASGCATIHLNNPPQNNVSRQVKISSSHLLKTIHLTFEDREKGSNASYDFEKIFVPMLKAGGYDLVDAEGAADLDLKVYYQKINWSRRHVTLMFFVIPVPGAFDLDHMVNSNGDFYSFYTAKVIFKTDSGHRNKTYLHNNPDFIANELIRDIEKIRIQPSKKGEKT